jgi:PAS domain S-box-containing protein
MNQFHDAIFESNSVIEFSPDAVILDVNRNMLDVFGEDRSVFIGKHLRNFISEEAYRMVEAAVEAGRAYEDVQVITSSSGDRKTVRQRFMPITDNDGKLKKVLMIATDESHIDELRQHEEELRQNMEEMQATQEEMRRRETELDAANFETDQIQKVMLITSQVASMAPNGIVSDVNDNIINAFEGATRDTFVGQPMEAFIGKAKFDTMMASCKRGESYEMVSGLPTGPNRITTFRQKFVPIRDKAGVLQRVMMIANDETYIEDMRQREEKVGNLAGSLEMLMKESKTGTWEMEIANSDPASPDNKYAWSDGFRHLLGYADANDFPDVMTSWTDKMHPDDKPKVMSDFREHITNPAKISYDLTYRLMKKDGVYAWFHAFGTTFRDAEGRALRITGAIQDVDEAYRREKEFKEQANWYETMLDSFDETPISVTDLDRNVTFINDAGLRILGKTREEVVGKPCAAVWNTDICGNSKCGIECLGKGSSIFKAGGEIFSTRASHMKDLNGNIIGYVEVVSNITQSEKAMAEIKNREHEMAQFHGAVFGTFNMVEFSADGIITDVNQNLINAFGDVSKDDFIGKPLSGLIGQEAFDIAWAKLAAGEYFEDVQKVSATGKTVKVRQKFMPILDRAGKLMKVIMLGMPE